MSEEQSITLHFTSQHR